MKTGKRKNIDVSAIERKRLSFSLISYTLVAMVPGLVSGNFTDAI